jgi:1-acyl-sn-glycerol-3-phosphate acyltransferase
VSPLFWILIASLALLGWALLCAWLVRNPRGDFLGGLVWRGLRLYARVFHRVSVKGAQNIPPADAGPLLVVSNHTAGVDPVLIQAVCPFEVRWVMARDMRHPWGEPFWRWARIIFVSPGRSEGNGAREAMRHLNDGGVLGMFPEGGIERPPRRILPFHKGIGLIIKRTGSPVLPIIIEGTPQVDPAWASLWRPSRSRIRVMPPVDYSDSGLRPDQIAEDLRKRYLDWTDWPANERASQPNPDAAPAYPGRRVPDDQP